MNYLSGLTVLLCLLICSACGASSAEPPSNAPDEYTLHYTVAIDPSTSLATVTMKLRQSHGSVREVSFAGAGVVLLGEQSNGDVSTVDERVVWRPSSDGGELRWTAAIAQRRNDNGYDAYVTADWGIFRAEDVIPRMRVRALKRSYSNTTLSFELPDGWSVVTEYSSTQDPIKIVQPARRFDQPTGWIAVGDLGVRRETIAATKVAVVAPKGQSVRRMDMLALLNWTLPELSKMLPEPMPRLTIFSANDPMWRGGLSAPASLFIHADRPLISENSTSTLIHEVMHIALRFDVAAQHDWITEGLAEYYSLELLRRAGAITPRRFDQAIRSQEAWSAESTQLCGDRSSGANTALAVTVFRRLDLELQRASGGKSRLDDVLVTLVGIDGEIGLATLRSVAEQVLNGESKTLRIEKLPGCSTMAAFVEKRGN